MSEPTIPETTTTTTPSPRYTITPSLPTPQQYHDLRRDTGMTPPPLPAVPHALAKSIHCILAHDTHHDPSTSPNDPMSNVVGMARLIGDGSLFLQIVDVCVLPAHQGRGLGSRMMQMLVEWVDAHAPEAYVSLIGHVNAAKFVYPKYGFLPVVPSVGMYRCERVRRRREVVGENP
ncbi:hypothetical protein EJ05DRAFT_511369 [Pseudovirgaria hyperparasitica]|uniref:N-acetyltransferase domain-containing protein n=1 Tax=Pseudovirgaria hyperparasitica TaxID=470096 RepID=A0A6A6W5Y3_9PEZI|nr:uncharacterized protein EJ05DRAFT_511369 [Pseudovirgaria hyperparasitica]KAF2757579.1 hypothetical protein EJ05DRAFT_511369 [Pseudovirgaria hyperparasitica]